MTPANKLKHTKHQFETYASCDFFKTSRCYRGHGNSCGRVHSF